MKVMTKKKFIGKFFKSKANKTNKSTKADPDVEDPPATEEPPEEGRELIEDVAAKSDPSDDREGTDEPEEEREAEPEADNDMVEEEPLPEAANKKNWMGDFLENVTSICAPVPVGGNTELSQVMSGEDLNDEPENIDAEEKQAEPAQEVATPKEPEAAEKARDLEPPATEIGSDPPAQEAITSLPEEPKVAEQPEGNEDNNEDPSGTTISNWACFNACDAVPSTDELELKEEDPLLELKPEETAEKEVEPLSEEANAIEQPADNEAKTAPVEDATAGVVAAKAYKPDPLQRIVTGKIYKESKKTKMGLSLKNSTMLPGVFITNIKENSLFSETALRDGMKVLKIQGQSCPSVLEDAVAMLRNSSGELEIVAEKPTCEI